MKGKLTKIAGLLVFTAALFSLFLFRPVPGRADGKEAALAGTVYASRLPDDAQIILRGDLTIIVNASKKISSITGRDDQEVHITEDSTQSGILTILQTEAGPAVSVGSLSIDTNVVITAPIGTGIETAKSITLDKGANVKIVALAGMKAGKSVSISGKLNVVAEGENGIEAGERILMQGGSTEVTSLLKHGLYARGNIELLQGTANVKGYEAIYSDQGNITISGQVKAVGSTNSSGAGVEANRGDILVDGSLICEGNYAVTAFKTLNITNQGSVQAAGKEAGLHGSTVILSGSVISKATNGNGLSADSLDVKGGTIEAEGTGRALSFMTMELAPSLVILSPAGAEAKSGTIITLEEKPATAVKIGQGKMISGSLKIPDDGSVFTDEKLTTVLSGAPEGQVHYQWQKEVFKTHWEWQNIKKATEDTYSGNPRADIYKVRCIATIDGYSGKIVSNEVNVQPCYPQFSEQLADVTVEVGQPVTITVHASNVKSIKWMLYSASTNSKGILEYKWVNSKMNKDTSYTAIEGQGTKSLTLTPKNTFMNGLYIGCELISPQEKTASSRMAAIKVTMPKPEAKGATFVGPDGATYKVVATKPLSVSYIKCPEKKTKTVGITGTVKYNVHNYRIVSIGASAFKNNTVVEEVKMGININAIEKNAFYGCKKLKKITLGKNVGTIGAKAFWKCTSLKDLTLPANVYKIDKYAFYGCSSLKKLTIITTRLTLKKTGKKAFKGTPAVMNIFVPQKELTYYTKLLRQRGVKASAKITAPKG